MDFERVRCDFIVEDYFASHSYRNVQNKFSDLFPGVQVLNKSTIKQTMDSFNVHSLFNSDIIEPAKTVK